MAIQVTNMTNPNAPLVPYGFAKMAVPNGAPASALTQYGGITQAAFDFHRAQLYDYSARLAAYGLRPGYPGLHAGLYGQDAAANPFLVNRFAPGARFIHEEPKPSQSYIGLIAMAILGSKDKKLVLSDIYQWILDNYSYFRNRGPGWRNSIRHNLSLNDCFIKSGRSANGKGHYWAVHPANVDDFTKGDFRRRRAQRKVRKHMGLSVPDEDDSPSPSPSPTPGPSPWMHGGSSPATSPLALLHRAVGHLSSPQSLPAKKRLFDMDSLLAPDDAPATKRARSASPPHSPTIKIEEIDAQDTNKDDENQSHISDSPLDMSTRNDSNSSSSPPTSRPSWPTTSMAMTPTLPPHHPLKYPTFLNSQTAAMAAQQWQETFSKILAKSYENELKVDVQ